MPTNREIYERGVLDAEHDDLNPFYYQHYYYYRKGYDEARRRLRRAPVDPRQFPRLIVPAILIGGLLLLALLFGPQLLAGIDFSAFSAASVEPSPTTVSLVPSTPPATPTARPTARPTPSPTREPQLAPGGVARVADLSGSPLRLREAPSQNGRLIARIPQGSEVTLLEGPVEADGFVWWRVQAAEGEGWSAAGTIDGATQFLEPIR
ncbi:MAG: SH3 domain-containing protein [Oscillochloris sp.]|nr:SH3 domain-containing protein [Oscillochloris sp.]